MLSKQPPMRKASTKARFIILFLKNELIQNPECTASGIQCFRLPLSRIRQFFEPRYRFELTFSLLITVTRMTIALPIGFVVLINAVGRQIPEIGPVNPVAELLLKPNQIQWVPSFLCCCSPREKHARRRAEREQPVFDRQPDDYLSETFETLSFSDCLVVLFFDALLSFGFFPFDFDFFSSAISFLHDIDGSFQCGPSPTKTGSNPSCQLQCACPSFKNVAKQIQRAILDPQLGRVKL